MASTSDKNECKPQEPQVLVPDPISRRPAPRPGQKWSFSELQGRAEDAWRKVEAGDACYHTVDAGEDWFRVLLGNFPPDPKSATGECKIPVLPGLGLYFWFIPPWYDDEQTPHKEDEAYFVVDGRGRLRVSGETQDVAKGDLVFVPRSAPHKFFTPYGESLTLLIIFSPTYSGGTASDPADRDQEYRKKSKAFVTELVERYRRRHEGC